MEDCFVGAGCMVLNVHYNWWVAHYWQTPANKSDTMMDVHVTWQLLQSRAARINMKKMPNVTLMPPIIAGIMNFRS